MSDIEEIIIEVSDSSSESSDDNEISFINTISISEKNQLNDTIHELTEEYVKREIKNHSKPDFYKNLIEEVTTIIFESFLDILCSDCDYDSILEFTEMTISDWFEQNTIYPLRQQSHIDYEYYTDTFGLADDFVKNMVDEKIYKLREINKTIPEQRSAEWYIVRHNMITASNLYKIFGSNAVQNQLVFEKCKPIVMESGTNYVNTMLATHWGVKYEPLSLMFYEEQTKTKVECFGCIPHSKYSFIGASPDGIITDDTSPYYGRMLEIKNIVNRNIDGIPSEAYWIQMQIQMEVCDLDVCDFLETRFKEYEETEFYQDDVNELKGVILYFIKREITMSNNPYYIYMPFSVKQDDIQQWIEKTKNEHTEHILFNTIYWYLDEYSLITVRRNDQWFQECLPQISNFWDIIQKERISGYDHRYPKKRVSSEPTTKNIDVIKLDTNT